jgi:hypothetical protein
VTWCKVPCMHHMCWHFGKHRLAHLCSRTCPWPLSHCRARDKQSQFCWCWRDRKVVCCQCNILHTWRWLLRRGLGQGGQGQVREHKCASLCLPKCQHIWCIHGTLHQVTTYVGFDCDDCLGGPAPGRAHLHLCAFLRQGQE